MLVAAWLFTIAGEAAPAPIIASEHHPRVGQKLICAGCGADVETQMPLVVVSLAGITPAADVLVWLTAVLRQGAKLLHFEEVGIESINDRKIEAIFVADAGNVAFVIWRSTWGPGRCRSKDSVGDETRHEEQTVYETSMHGSAD